MGGLPEGPGGRARGHRPEPQCHTVALSAVGALLCRALTQPASPPLSCRMAYRGGRALKRHLLLGRPYVILRRVFPKASWEDPGAPCSSQNVLTSLVVSGAGDHQRHVTTGDMHSTRLRHVRCWEALRPPLRETAGEDGCEGGSPTVPKPRLDTIPVQGTLADLQPGDT